jgi:hypothetical protein
MFENERGGGDMLVNEDTLEEMCFMLQWLANSEGITATNNIEVLWIKVRTLIPVKLAKGKFFVRKIL